METPLTYELTEYEQSPDGVRFTDTSPEVQSGDLSRRELLGRAAGLAASLLVVTHAGSALRIADRALVEPADAHPLEGSSERNTEAYRKIIKAAGYWDIKAYQQAAGLPVRKQRDKVGPWTKSAVDRGIGLDVTTPIIGRLIEVDIDQQLLRYYDQNRARIIARISSGSEKPWKKNGRSGNAVTPTGEFQVLGLGNQKTFSSIFGPEEGKMPWAIFLGRIGRRGDIDDGIRIHGGKNPGFPASHGCIRTNTEAALEMHKMGIRRGDRIRISGSAQNFRNRYL